MIHNWPWKPNPDYERLLKALRRQGDPDHVPFLELFADREVIAAALGEPVITGEIENLPERGTKVNQEALEKLGGKEVFVSLSHERDNALAMVVIEGD